jgi:hypothetical protein
MNDKQTPPEPAIALSQLAEQLQRYEGQVILNGLGLAVAIYQGTRDV